ncbi:unnamed protein product [Arctia plantaginis]|uniref:Flavin-containing monooxygenase n=1 Tax=Arctia plantaginis TaxID=874455 RepID=A0A8S1AMN2_ARCPL|nr:unnamed protein product [Arctia plantaginis]
MTHKSFRTSVFLLSVFLEISDVFTKSPQASQVCIIGAGYSGLATARYMKDYGLNFKVFEATRYIGGTWRFDPNVGTDEDGLPLFTSQYKNLRINSPYQTMEFSGFPFPEGSASYVTGTCYYEYLKAFAKKFDLFKNIQFRSLITKVKWTGDKWKVTYMKSDTRKNITEKCNVVVVASGEFNSPNIPHFEGQEAFKGKLMHSHNYKDPEDFRNQRVLVIGGGPSGLDIAAHLVNVSSKLFHSHHLIYNEPDFGGQYMKKPDLRHFTSTGAVFADGSTEEFEVVILCTGYNYRHPFLNHKTSGITATDKYVMPLYQHIVNINHPTMLFVGISKLVMTRLRDAEAQYSAALVAGKFKLPSQEEMFHHWLDHLESIKKKNHQMKDINLIGVENMSEYLNGLHKEAGIARMLPVLPSMSVFNEMNLLEDFLNFRDYDYKIISDTQYVKSYNPKKRPCLIYNN